VFAVAARDRIRADGPFAQPAFTVVMLFTGVIIAPFTLYLYVAHAAWTWMYLLDPDKVPSLTLIPLLVLHGGMVVVGWYIGGRLVRASKSRVALYAAAATLLLLLLLVFPLWGRLGIYGTYDEYRERLALPLMEVKLGYVLVALMLGVAVAGAFAGLELLRDSRRVKSR
jgi:hypothetical protein